MISFPRVPGLPLLFTALLCAFLPAVASAVTLMQVDDFESGNIGGWRGGGDPTVIADGGPDGAGDAYVRIKREGIADFLGMFTTSARWGGRTPDAPSDYVSEGITGMTMDVANFGPDPVELRIMMLGFLILEAWTTTDAITIAPTGTWQNITFNVTEDDMTHVRSDSGEAGSDQIEFALSTVERVLIRHDPDDASPPFSNPEGEVTATLGIDNITAGLAVIPEPSRGMLLVLGAVSATVVRRRWRK